MLTGYRPPETTDGTDRLMFLRDAPYLVLLGRQLPLGMHVRLPSVMIRWRGTIRYLRVVHRQVLPPNLRFMSK
jgi:hypothetical protein